MFRMQQRIQSPERLSVGDLREVEKISLAGNNVDIAFSPGDARFYEFLLQETGKVSFKKSGVTLCNDLLNVLVGDIRVEKDKIVSSVRLCPAKLKPVCFVCRHSLWNRFVADLLFSSLVMNTRGCTLPETSFEPFWR